ncbi:ABC transporter ATP-binding protein, partial [Halomonas sp. BBD48]|nr:ABC transporter ATP-binding protein [Halomonas sp. BBD48]
DWVRQGGRLPPAPWDFDASQVSKQAKKGGAKTEGKPEASPESAVSEPAGKKTVKLSYKLQRELDVLPATIEALEEEIAAFETRISQPDFYQQDNAEVTRVLAALTEKQNELDATMERWMELEAMATGEAP